MSLRCSIAVDRRDFSLDVDFIGDGAVLGVVGPSGAGKTTLLQAMAGLIPVRRAHLTVNGTLIVDTDEGVAPPAHRRRIGYVFQDNRLFPHLSVAGNLGFGAAYVDDPMPVDEALALVDLEGYGDRRPYSLSGGEMQRVAIARVLVTRPMLLLLDEPFTGLDDARREAILPYFQRLKDEVGTPMVMVSHHQRDIDALCDDTLRLARGRLIEHSAADGPR